VVKTNTTKIEVYNYRELIEFVDYIQSTTDSLLIKAELPDIVQIIEPENGKAFDYKELQGYLGGLIQIVPLLFTQAEEWKNHVVLVNEEGINLNLPMNILSRLGNYFNGHTLFGNVLIVHRSNWE
tara:strand:- start:6375 stop:6749 length:375 start_codon:yes stop_codon:yes gene_type:complete